eukprot:scaffold141292_cov36-Tisochrysis_lutea.AAC.1
MVLHGLLLLDGLSGCVLYSERFTDAYGLITSAELGRSPRACPRPLNRWLPVTTLSPATASTQLPPPLRINPLQHATRCDSGRCSSHSI